MCYNERSINEPFPFLIRYPLGFSTLRITTNIFKLAVIIIAYHLQNASFFAKFFSTRALFLMILFIKLRFLYNKLLISTTFNEFNNDWKVKSYTIFKMKQIEAVLISINML